MDSETTAAFDKLHERISETAREGREQGRRIESKVEALGRETTALGAELHAHIQHDTERFERNERELANVEKKADRNGAGLAKLSGAAVGGGGVVAALMELFKKGSA
jgi:mevalonate kinase